MTVSRRTFLQQGTAVTAGFLGLQRLVESHAGAASGSSRGANAAGYGPPVSDPDGVMDLPDGFSYRIISRLGEPMTDGFLVPGLPDGMAAFGDDSSDLTVLVRNHELTPNQSGSPFGSQNLKYREVPPGLLYDPGKGVTPSIGGTTNVVYDTKKQKVVRQFLSLAGTQRNCAGGPTPWGTWLTCEETVARVGFHVKGMFQAERDHGFVFEVPAVAEPELAEPVPLKAMGRFNHEAVAIDPQTGIAYLTEDRKDGCLYRFIPADTSSDRPDYRKGGRLQALVVKGLPRLDTRNWDPQSEPIRPHDEFEVQWVDLDEVEAPRDDLRQRAFQSGAARFARAEGIWYGDENRETAAGSPAGRGTHGSSSSKRDDRQVVETTAGTIYFACTTGGAKRLGQIWKYTPGEAGSGDETGEETAGRLELFLESHDSKLLENADNLTVAPWGDLIVCEDRGTEIARLIGVTPKGEPYVFAAGRLRTELAGATFSPDGSTLFVNMQKAGTTLAITGPWPGLSKIRG